MAGVISEPEAVLAAVLGGQDLLKETARLQSAGQSMLRMISEVLVKQAENDVEMENMVKETSRIDRIQKINALLTAVFSFAPLGGAAVANTIGAVAEALPLLESMIGTTAGVQGVVSPLILERFNRSASSIVSVDGWARVTPENRKVVREAAEGLGMTWPEFCDMVTIASRRRTEASGDSEDVPFSVRAIGSCAMQGVSIPGGSESSTSLNSSASFDSSESVSPAADRSSFENTGASNGHTAGGISIIESVIAQLEISHSDSLFIFAELKAAAFDKESLASMKIEPLARTIAAVLINFDEYSRPRLPVLANCLRAVFHDLSIGGDLLLDYPEEMLKSIAIALRKNEAYTSYGDIANENFERRLQRFLQITSTSTSTERASQ